MGEMKSIAEALPPACFVSGICATPDARERKKRMDWIYVDYRRALKGEASALGDRNAFAVKLSVAIKKKVTVVVEGARKN